LSSPITTFMKTAVIIPSRYGSTRLKAKPLIEIRGKTLIQHVYERARLADNVDGVFVATDHAAIADAVRAFGGEVLMTSEECESGTDRVAEAALELPQDYDVIINVQGDEPLIDPGVIGLLAQVIREDDDLDVVTPITPITNASDLTNPNVVKVVTDIEENALYFSRSPIPYVRDTGSEPGAEWLEAYQYYRHVGVYAYRREILEDFAGIGESPLERAEKLEQLRLLEAGVLIQCVVVDYDSIAVDTESDIAIVERRLDAQNT
jgi:3-deoxy-manno-octulosonate cytidylyltransferase (CMP-KDO synthetase)